MTPFDTTLPPLLRKLHALYDEDESNREWMDFETYSEFQSAAENKRWIKAWTGNAKLTGKEYRIFGQDGTGGYAAFWLARPGKDLLEQPIVFFGSEGDLGVIAKDFASYTWLLAGGCGPSEAVASRPPKRAPRAAFTAFAKEHFPGAKKKPAAIIAEAGAEFPTFSKDLLGT